MDFSPTPEQVEVTALAARILADGCTQERLQAVDAQEARFDATLWRTVADAGLLGLALPEDVGGAGLGLLESTSVLVEAGPSPVLVTVPSLRHPVARLLRSFDHRLRVLAFTELEPDLGFLPGGLVSAPRIVEATRVA